MDELRELLQLAEHTGRGVDVSDSKELVVLRGQGLLDLVKLGSGAGSGLDLSNDRSIGGQAVGEAVAEVAGLKNEDIVTGLDEVSGNEIPSESTGTGDDEGLRGRVGSLEELPELRKRVAEDRDEAGSDMALTVGFNFC